MQIEIFSDVVCPWCYIGKRRLDSVLQAPVGEELTLRWRPYQLHPSLPAEGIDRLEYLQGRYGPDADPAHASKHLEAEARDLGLRFNFAAIRRQPNTFNAHRLLEFAQPQGVQHQLAEVLFDFHFRAGEDLGQAATLVRAAEQAGLDRGAAEAYLAGDSGAEAVRAQLSRAAALGIAGVPCYLLVGRFRLPGAQAPEVMGQFIQRARALSRQ